MTNGTSCSTWTENRLRSLSALWEDGCSCSVIAIELNRIDSWAPRVTRNAVIGKVHRLGLQLKPRKNVKRKKMAGRLEARIAAAEARQPRKLALRCVPVEVRPAPVANPPVAPAHLPECVTPLFELSPKGCRWPASGESWETEHTFCNANQVDGLSYCPGHARMAYQAG